MPMSSGSQSRTSCSVRLDVVPGLAGIAELQEEADVDAGRLEPPRRLADLLDRRALLHRVEDCLRARLRADPDGLAAGPPQRLDLAGRSSRSARLRHLNGVRRPSRFDSVRELAHPARLEPEDVVHEPEVIGAQRAQRRASPRRRLPGCGRCSAGPRSAWRTSCSGTGSRASSRGSSRSSRGACQACR